MNLNIPKQVLWNWDVNKRQKKELLFCEFGKVLYLNELFDIVVWIVLKRKMAPSPCAITPGAGTLSHSVHLHSQSMEQLQVLSHKCRQVSSILVSCLGETISWSQIAI